MLHKTGRPAEGEGWTDARVAWLKELWAEGHSAGQIANIMGGGVSRSAVIGKVHRLKLSPRSTVVAHPRPHGNKGQPKANAIVHRLATKKQGNKNGGLGFKLAKARKDGLAGKEAMDAVLGHGAAPEVLDIPPELPDVTPLIGSVLGLTERTCKWPIGNPGEPDFGFCGRPKPIDCPYCDEHAKRAYGVRS